MERFPAQNWSTSNLCALLVCALASGNVFAAQRRNAAPQSQGDARNVTPPPASRALVWDDKGAVLHALDPESGRSVQSVQVPVGSLFTPRDRTRLVAFWEAGALRLQHATILDRASLRVIGDVPMGSLCVSIFEPFPRTSEDIIESLDGRYFTVRCWDPVAKRREPNRKMRLISIDLMSATRSASLLIDSELVLMKDLGAGRAVLLPARIAWKLRPNACTGHRRAPRFRNPSSACRCRAAGTSAPAPCRQTGIAWSFHVTRRFPKTRTRRCLAGL